MCAAVAIFWSVRDFLFCVAQHLQRKKKAADRQEEHLTAPTTIVCLCVPQEGTERSYKHQRRPNPGDTLAVCTTSFSQQTALIWHCARIISGGLGWWGRVVQEWTLGTTQRTVFTMNNSRNPRKNPTWICGGAVQAKCPDDCDCYQGEYLDTAKALDAAVWLIFSQWAQCR